MRKRRAVVLFVTLATLVAGGTRADIELPFEYFYGRWVPTQSLSGQLELRDHVETRRGASYSFTGQRSRLSLTLVPESTFFPGFPDVGVYPLALAQTRPRRNWQIGMDSLYYWEWKTETKLTAARPSHESYAYRMEVVEVSSHWLSEESLIVDDRHGAFSYLVRPMLTTGVLKLDNLLRFRHSNSDRERSYIRTQSYPIYGSAEVVRRRLSSSNSRNSLRWGIDSDLNVSLKASLYYGVEDRNDSRAGSDPDGSYYQSDLHSFERTYVPEYELSLTSGHLAPVYFEASLNQEYRSGHVEIDRYSYSTIYDSLQSDQGTNDAPLKVRLTSFTLAVHYVTEGEFDSGVILDDYSGFYRRMLFHRQVKAGLRIFGYGAASSAFSGVEWATVVASLAVGFIDHWQVDLQTEYTWYKYEDQFHAVSPESIQPKVTIAFRSYRYERDTGPGWDRDSRYDIVFGPTMSFGQLYGTLTISPPMLVRYAYEGVPFLSFSGLASYGGAQVTLHVEAGLGRGIEIEVEYREDYFHSEIQRRIMTAGLVWRFLPYAEAKGAFLRNYQRGYWDEPTITIEGRVLF